MNGVVYRLALSATHYAEPMSESWLYISCYSITGWADWSVVEGFSRPAANSSSHRRHSATKFWSLPSRHPA